jgi:hypothetical protein
MKSLPSLLSKSFFLLFFFLLPLTSFATTGFVRQINYQGKLTDSTGATVADGSYKMRFKLYNALTGGTEIWTNTLIQNDRVTVTNGLFSVMLGATSTALTSVDFNQPLYLSIDIGGTDNTASLLTFDGEMSPRKTLGTVPHAFNADKIDGLDSTALVRSDAVSTVATSSSQTILTLNQLGMGDILSLQSNNTAFLTVTNAGRLGVGTTSPSTAFSVVGSLYASTTATSTFQGGGINLVTGAGNTGCFAVNGDCITGGGSQTPWTTDINGNGKNLTNVNQASTTLLSVSGTFYAGGTGTTTINSLGNVLIPNGSVASPSFTFANDASNDTGIFSAGENTLSLVTGGADRLRINSSGYVGIGTTSPGSLFSVFTITNFSNPTTTFYTGLNLTSGCFAVSGTCISSSGGGTINTGTAGQLAYYASNGTTISGTSTISLATTGELTVNSTTTFNRFVGIGTSTPLFSLDVASTTRTSSLIAGNITISQSYDSIISAVVGSSTGYTNFSGGIGTGGADSIGGAFNNALRITNTGNLVNIGSIQGGETLLTNGGTFGPITEYSLPSTSNSQDAAIGDVNGDGKADFVVTVGGSNDQVFVYRNLGNGSFTSTTYSVGDNPSDVAIGDLNGDGKADLAVANSNADTMSVLINNGNGTFATQVTHSTGSGGGNPNYIAIGDLNGDGKADVATTNSGNIISLFFNKGDGTFPTFGVLDSPPRLTTGSSPKDVAIGDLNGDGRADVITANSGDDNVGIFLNTGNGTFASQTTASVGDGPASVVIGDLNGDGIIDITALNQSGSSVSVLINRGNGTFNTQITLGATSSFVSQVGIADLNGDGANDLATANGVTSSSVTIYLNQGNASFASTTYSNTSHPKFIALGDLNGDGKADILTVDNPNDKVAISYNQVRSIFYASASTGNVAIGTSTATSTASSLFAKFTVWASTSPNGTAMNIVNSASSTLFNIGNNGNVGVGTSTPGSLFAINGIANFTSATSTFASTGGINLNNGCFAVGGTCISGGGSQTPWTSDINGNGKNLTNVNQASTTRLSVSGQFWAGGTGTTTITSAGFLGVGVSDPISKLEVRGDDNLQLRVGNSGNSGKYISAWVGGSDGVLDMVGATAGFNFFMNGLSKMYLSNEGNLGIGTTSPYAKLSVVGEVVARNFTATSTTGISSFAGFVGLGTTSPYAKLSISGGNFIHVASSSPTLTAIYNTPDFADGVYVSGKYAYIADGSSLQIIDISNPSSPASIGSVTTSASEDVYVAGKYAYVADGSSGGLRIVDVSNPVSPRSIGNYDSSGSAQGIYVSGKYAYLADGLSGLEVFDISNPATPLLVGNYNSSGASRDVYVFGNYAYVADDTTGLQIIDVSNPTNPLLVGSLDTSEAFGVYVSGRYAYVGDGNSGLRIIDVSNPSSPTLISTYDTADFAYGVYVSGRYAYVADQNDGLYVIDVSNPTSPSLVGTYNTGNLAYGIYVSGKYGYVGDGTSGLNIIDINGIETPSLFAGNIGTNDLTVSENVDIGNSLFVRNGLNVGNGGIFSGGPLSVYGISTTSATSTSLFSISATSTGNLFTVLNTGNVGIGTTTPIARLTVSGGGFSAENIILSNSYGSIISAVVGSSTGYTNFSGGIGTGGADSIGGPFNNALRITNTGNLVNIGSIQGGETLLTSAGTFGSATSYSIGSGSFPASVALGDVNGDGWADAAVVDIANDSVSIFINNGNGTFTIRANPATGDAPFGVAIGDLNGDGKADMAVTNRITSGTVSVFINNGSGTFAAQTPYSAGSEPHGIVLGDVNGDGKSDMVVTNRATGGGGNTISVFINNGNGTFATQATYATESAPYGIALGDVNGDGRADIAVTNRTSGTVSVFINNGNGTFATQVSHTSGTTAESIAIGDVNGDGKADMVATNNGDDNVAVFINRGNGTFPTSGVPVYSTGDSPVSIALGDVNGDGRPDISTANFGGTSASVLINNSNGSFSTNVNYMAGTNPLGIALGDINGDGKADMIVANDGSENISVFLNQSRAMFYANSTNGNIAVGTSTGTTTPHSLFAKFTVWGASTTANTYALNAVNSASSTLFTISNAGYVTVGSTTPGGAPSALNVITSGTNDARIFVGSSVAQATGNTAELVFGTGTGFGDVNGPRVYAFQTALAGGSPTDLRFDTYLSGRSTKMTITATGNVGIGTTSPYAKLSVVGEAVASYFTATTTNATSTFGGPLSIGGSNSTTTIAGFLDVNGTGTNATSTFASNLWVKGTVQIGTGSLFLNNSGISSTDGSISLTGGSAGSTFGTTTITRLTVSATSTFNGLVGIGTSSPLYSLDIATTTRTANFIAQNITLSQSYGSIISAVVGSSTGYTNFSGGIGTGGADSIGGAFNNALRITNTGNLVNIGSIQGGETLLSASSSFAAKVDYGTGTTPQDIAVGDFNGDNKADLITSNGSSDTISVFRNLGSGTFASTTFSTGSGPYGVRVGDLNGDGKADLAVVNNAANSFSILMNNGNGTFANKVDYGTGAAPRYLSIGDLNGDGKADIAVAATGSSNDSVTVSLNNGNGTFASSTAYVASGNPIEVAIGDLNGDGKADLATVNGSGANISVLMNRGDGTFATAVNTSLSGSTDAIAIGDLSGDGIADIAIASFTVSNIKVLINNGNGTFASAVTYTAGAGTEGIAIGDLNGDGKADIATANTTAANTSVFINNGDGTFPTTGTTYTTGTGTNHVAIGDLNADGKSDIITSNGTASTISVLMNTPTTMFYAEARTGRVGIGTSTPISTLSVQGSLCVRDTGSCGTAPGNIYATTITLNDIDLAERFQRFEDGMEAGDIVAVSDENISTATTSFNIESFGIRRADGTRSDKVLGIISTKPGIALGKDIPNSSPVALAGRVPVKVNLEGGPIAVGDYVTLSSEVGIGMKATTSGQVVGMALEAFDGSTLLTTGGTTYHKTGKIVVFVNLGYQQISPIAADASLMGTLMSHLTSLGARIEQGIAYFKDIIAESISTKNIKVDSGVTTKDRATGKYYCMYIDNGEVKTEEGECTSSGGNQSQPASSTPPTDTEAPVVSDIEPPVIQLIGNATSTLSVGDSYVDPGASITDNMDHNLGVHTDGQVDTGTPGEYTLTYSAEDSAGNKAVEITRVVTVTSDL